MSTTVNNTARGTSILFPIFVVLVILKMVGVIAWSWWWVTAPLWIPVVIALGVVAIFLIIGGLSAAFIALYSPKRKRR